MSLFTLERPASPPPPPPSHLPPSLPPYLPAWHPVSSPPPPISRPLSALYPIQAPGEPPTGPPTGATRPSSDDGDEGDDEDEDETAPRCNIIKSGGFFHRFLLAMELIAIMPGRRCCRVAGVAGSPVSPMERRCRRWSARPGSVRGNSGSLTPPVNIRLIITITIITIITIISKDNQISACFDAIFRSIFSFYSCSLIF